MVPPFQVQGIKLRKELDMEVKFYKYLRRGWIEARPYQPGENLEGISVNKEDIPSPGGMIARNPNNHEDKWYVNPSYFSKNYVADDPHDIE